MLKILVNIDKQSSTPVYEQIIEQIKHLILLGIVANGEQIPSVRSMSMELSVNPNTIQKAYNELELCGITYSVPGVGRFVTENAKEKIEGGSQKKLDLIFDTAYWLALAGIDRESVIKTVNQAYGSAVSIKERNEDKHDKSTGTDKKI